MMEKPSMCKKSTFIIYNLFEEDSILNFNDGSDNGFNIHVNNYFSRSFSLLIYIF